MKIRSLSLILLLSLLLCSCVGEGLAPPTETAETAESIETLPQTKEKKTEESEAEPTTEEIPLALRLTEEEKLSEIARLSGGIYTDAAMAHAREMLAECAEFKEPMFL